MRMTFRSWTILFRSDTLELESGGQSNERIPISQTARLPGLQVSNPPCSTKKSKVWFDHGEMQAQTGLPRALHRGGGWITPALSISLAAAWRCILDKQRKALTGNKLYVSSFLTLVMPVDKCGTTSRPNDARPGWHIIAQIARKATGLEDVALSVCN